MVKWKVKRRKTGYKYIGWTADFTEFKKKVEPMFGPIKELAKTYPDLYCHQVLSHGFMEYSGIKNIKGTKKNFKDWMEKNHLEKSLVEAGWKEYKED